MAENIDYDYDGEGTYTFFGKTYRHDQTPTPIEVGWSNEGAAPIDDFRAMVDSVANQTGYAATKLILSPREADCLARWNIWYAETEKLLNALPRRKYLSRRVLEVHLYGHPRATSVKQMIAIRKARAKSRFWYPITRRYYGLKRRWFDA